jgi:4-aminobutyrate aminotransferase-like enzyme/tRNA A-37 threonylcarbamoyl transferase component Bud32
MNLLQNRLSGVDRYFPVKSRHYDLQLSGIMSLYPYLTTNLIPRAPGYLVSGRGALVIDAFGREYIDLSAQTLNLALGHVNVAVHAGVMSQIDKIWFTSSRFSSKPFLELSKKLISLAPKGITAIAMKMCDGSDAVETAIKMARLHRRTHRILCISGAWHGETAQALSLSSYEHSKEYVSGYPDVAFSREPTLASLLALIENNPTAAAVIIDPIGVSNGLFNHGELRKYLPKIRDACDCCGALLVFDEIQTFGGFLGRNLFAAESLGVIPDIICVSKALGAGLPLAAALCTEELRGLLDYNNAEFTNGGQALACAAGLAALDDYIERREVYGSLCEDFGRILGEYFTANSSVELRKHGFLCTIARTQDRFRETWTQRVDERALQAGILVRRTERGRRILVKPPIIIDQFTLRRACAILVEVIDGVEKDLQLGEGIRTKPIQQNKHEFYVGELLRTLGPGFSARTRTALEQENISDKLLLAGVPASRVHASTDAIDAPFYAGQSADNVLPVWSRAGDYPSLNAFVIRQQNAIEMAHSAGILIGDRWPGNTIIRGDEIILIDFDIAYDGQLGVLTAFEELFSLYQTIAHIDNREFARKIAARFIPAFRGRHPSNAGRAWQAINTFYGRIGKTTTPTSLSHDTYRKASSVFRKHF